MEDGQERLRAYTKRENILLEQIRCLTAEYQHLSKLGQRQDAVKIVEQLEAAINEYAKERVKNTSSRERVIK